MLPQQEAGMPGSSGDYRDDYYGDRENVPKSRGKAAAQKEALSPELAAAHMTESQAAHLREAVAKLTDLDSEIVAACAYSNLELIHLFNEASGHHNEIAANFRQLQQVDTTNSFRTGGDYSRGVSITEHAVKAVQHHAKIQHGEQKLNRLAQRITTRALLRAGKAAP
jgi:hypothetical protein